MRFERDVFRAEWVEEPGDVLAFWIEADTFMRHMVRILVGTMLEGLGAGPLRRAARGTRRAASGGDGARPRALPGERRIPLSESQMRVLLTNDDGITATGLNVMRRALLELPDVELEVIAPDSNRSATGRAVTLRDPIWVEEVEFGDGTTGFATDGTPVDCVRFAALGLIEAPPELIVSGINHGANLGDDITYSGTVAAALEGIMLGLPAVAVSLSGRSRDFEPLARFVARLVEELDEVPMPEGHAPERERPARRGRRARARAGSASASTTTRWSSPRRASAAGGATACTARSRATSTSRAPTSPRSPRA